MRGVLGTALLAVGVLAGGRPPDARAGDAAPDSTYWQQDVRYWIDATVDDRGDNLDGRETVDYANRSPDTLGVLWFHLYPNAFRDTHSTYMRDRLATYNWVVAGLPEAYRHWMNVGEVTVDSVAVPWQVDDTLLRLDLARPLAPGETARVAMRFHEHIGRPVARAGTRGRHMDVGQWYPKPVVYDEHGWHLDQYRSRGEFYGEFGTFDVTLTLPSDAVVAATGEPVAGDPGWDAARRRVTTQPLLVVEDTLVVHATRPAGAAPESTPPRDSSSAMKTLTFHAERVHDFAWVSDPTFALQDTMLGSVHVLSFYRAWNVAWKDSSLAHAIRALQWLARLAGPYPYPAVSIVDALRGGGMEYPMLVMDSRADEALAAHEIGHIYFYGMLADNEMDEAWMDEGFTTWQTTHYMTSRYGPRAARPPRDRYAKRLPALGVWDRNAVELIDLQRSGYWEPVSTPAWAFRNSYTSMVYAKGARTLEALRYTVGDSAFAAILHEYYRRWQFHHVNEARFRAVCEEVVARDLGWFFDEWLHRTDPVDYRWRRAGRGLVAPEARSGARMPLLIARRHAGGEMDAIRRDGGVTERDRPVSTEGLSALTINPANEILDVDMLDNTWPAAPVEYRFDYPFWSYRPPRRYLVAMRPSVAWDSTGGVAPGWRVRSSYLGDTWATNVTAWYATRARRLNGRVAFSTPFTALGPRSTIAAAAEAMGGRAHLAAEVARTLRKTLARPPDVRWSIGGELWDVDDLRYAPGWSRGSVAALRLGGGVSPRADVATIDAQGALTLGRFAPRAPEPEGPSAYARAFASATAHSDWPWQQHARVAVRLAGGWVSGRAPGQQLFRLAGNPPLVAWRDPLARSQGTLPDDAHYQIGGDAGLRGYVDANPELRSFVSLGAMLGPARSPQLPLVRRVARTTAYAFGDAGYVTLPGRAHAAVGDLGVGAVFSRAVGASTPRLRIDVPFLVAHPGLADQPARHALALRWAIGLAEAF